LIVILAIGALAACAPIGIPDVSGAEDYVRALPSWVIIIGAIALFFIGFGIIWKLIPGFVKVLALIALAAIIAGVAYGLWNIPLVDKAIDKVDELVHPTEVTETFDPAD
jgi:NADH:ubiquinone oxidoreductase subunit K